MLDIKALETINESLDGLLESVKDGSVISVAIAYVVEKEGKKQTKWAVGGNVDTLQSSIYCLGEEFKKQLA